MPHFTTYGKNYVRRFQDRQVIEGIFTHILGLCVNAGFIDPTEIFIDGIHIKAAANNRKFINREVEKQAKFMSEQLEIEINRDREKTNSLGIDCLFTSLEIRKRVKKSR